jgi:hypothetical protein
VNLSGKKDPALENLSKVHVFLALLLALKMPETCTEGASTLAPQTLCVDRVVNLSGIHQRARFR